MFVNAIAMQAANERSIYASGDSVAHPLANIAHARGAMPGLPPSDQHFISEVVTASSTMLKIAISHAGKGTLCFAPHRTYTRIATASIFILEALRLGSDLSSTVDIYLLILDECIASLRAIIPDDVHPGLRCSVLIERHVARFRKHCLATTTSSGCASTLADTDPRPGSHGVRTGMLAAFGDLSSLREAALGVQDLLAQPLDQTTVSSTFGGWYHESGLDLYNLDFIYDDPED